MLIYAHRGARGDAPENTMSAFKKALLMNADGIELDVQLTKDGELVICHDHTIDRTSNGTGWIKDFSLKELKAYDFGGWFDSQYGGETLPTLAEFLDWFSTTPLLLNIEIKHGPVIYPNLEPILVDCIRQYNIDNRLILSSFYHPSLQKIKALNSNLKTGALFSCRPLDPCQFCIDTHAEFLHPHWHCLDALWVKKAKDLGIGINTFTVNEETEYQIVSKLGVDAIFTDFPGRFSAK